MWVNEWRNSFALPGKGRYGANVDRHSLAPISVTYVGESDMTRPIKEVAQDVVRKMADDVRNGFVAVHPGGIFRRRVIDRQGLSVESTADRMGVSRQMLHRVLSGQSSVTADMAVRMAAVSRSRPETWLQLQNQYDLAQVVRGTEISFDSEQLARAQLQEFRKAES